ncbi:UPF0575 protein C19orf67 homolog isoform X2 [Embiotoca jacksoni]|uniref:UPF0575 protein C19orf67 homolog isoform X2 n=1 Tax=Embiotoca jacksoni TaxID=100190 RepID=UPI0037048C03
MYILSGVSEVEEPLLLLADVALASSSGSRSFSCLETRRLQGSIHSMQLQLQFLMNKADDLHDFLTTRQGQIQGDTLAAAVPSFLYTCQPFFNHLESTARSPAFQHARLPVDLSRRLLDFSQQLCDRLEQLVLTYASYNLLCLDESEPNNVSHFCIGQSQLGCLRMTIFRYCKPTAYLSSVDTGLYKRMRWNVERLRDDQQQPAAAAAGESEAREAVTVGDPDYYFLCYEDVPSAHAEADRDSQRVPYRDVVRMWSIGQWVQVNPDPNTEDIYDWIVCRVPQAKYHSLVFLGSDEPTSCSATYCLQQLLSSNQTAD